MSAIQDMIQSNKMNRGMQRSGKFLSALNSMPNAKYECGHIFSMEVDEKKLAVVKQKWKRQLRADRLKVVTAIVFVVFVLLAICSVMATWDYSGLWTQLDI